MPTRTALPVRGISALQQFAGLGAVVGPARFHQRDGARQHRAIAAGDGVGPDIGLARGAPGHDQL